jgi:metacaspase-1
MEASMNMRALLVGLNHYPNPENNLKGCVNDVLQMSSLLQHGFGFEDSRQIRLLTDERATTGAIKDRLRWLLSGTGAGDVLVFHYSGHGAQVRDRHGDELDDGLDEIICPYELDWDHPFTDDDLADALKDLQPGVNLTVILDCCHAGTGLRDLRTGSTWPARVKCLPPPPDIHHRTGPLIQDLGTGRSVTMTRTRIDLRLRRFGTQAAQAGATLLAACRSDQVSADAWIDGDFHGAFTYFLCTVAEQGAFRMTYADLVSRTRHLLKMNRYDQVPQLEGPRDVGSWPVFRPLSSLVASPLTVA